MADEAKLREASLNGDSETVTNLLSKGVPQTPDTESGNTPLLLATSCYVTDPKYSAVVRNLLEAGAAVNAKNKSGDAAIHNTATNGNLEIMELILEYGGDIEAEGEMNFVPLGLAATKRHNAVVNLLVNKLLTGKAFSKKQVEWMNNAENEVQQLHIYRALTAIFQNKDALAEMVKYGVVEAILKGMKRFSKKAVQTSGLQLLHHIVAVEGSLAAANDVKSVILECSKIHAGDGVVEHLVKQLCDAL